MGTPGVAPRSVNLGRGYVLRYGQLSMARGEYSGSDLRADLRLRDYKIHRTATSTALLLHGSLSSSLAVYYCEVHGPGVLREDLDGAIENSTQLA